MPLDQWPLETNSSENLDEGKYSLFFDGKGDNWD